jgi:serine/threonine-protein kinase
MGIVFKAIEDRSEDIVAIKCLLPCHANREDFAARFEEECRFYPKLKHLNIVRMRRTGVAQLPAPPPPAPPPPPIPFIVMDLLEGKTLRKILNRYHRLDYLNTLNILIQIADPMRVAHDKGIVHRDLKPENVMVGSNGDEKGHVWIMDFGIAKDVHRGLNTEDMPDMGTARYMAPEQVRNVFGAGKRGKRVKVDHRADIYAFGVIGYELVTGRHYFINDSDPPSFEETLAGHLVAEPTPIYQLVPECPEHMQDLWLILEKCLAKDPDQRYQSFDEVLDALQALVRGSVPPTHPLGRRVLAERARSARRAAFASLATEPPKELPRDPEPSGREALTPEPPAPAEATAQPSTRPEAAARVAFAPTVPAALDAPPEVEASAAPADPPERGTIPLVHFVPKRNPLPFVPPAAPFVPSVPLLKPNRGVGGTLKMQQVPDIPQAVASPMSAAHDAPAPADPPSRGVGGTLKMQQVPDVPQAAASRMPAAHDAPAPADPEPMAASHAPVRPAMPLPPTLPAAVAFAMAAPPPRPWSTTAAGAAGSSPGTVGATPAALAGLSLPFTPTLGAAPSTSATPPPHTPQSAPAPTPGPPSGSPRSASPTGTAFPSSAPAGSLGPIPPPGSSLRIAPARVAGSGGDAAAVTPTAPAGHPLQLVPTPSRPTPSTPSTMTSYAPTRPTRRRLLLAPLVGLVLVGAASLALVLVARSPARSGHALAASGSAASGSAAPGPSAGVASAAAAPASTLPAAATTTAAPTSAPTSVPTAASRPAAGPSARPSVPLASPRTAAPAPAPSTHTPVLAMPTVHKPSPARTPVIPLVGD